MKRTLMFLMVAIATGTVLAPAALACGDKHLVGGASARWITQNLPPGRVLIYAPTSEAAAWRSKGAKLQKLGHTITIIEDSNELQTTLDRQEIDIVMLPIELARQWESRLLAQSVKLIVLPYIVFATSSDLSRAEREFGQVVKWPETARKLENAIFRSLASAVN